MKKIKWLLSKWWFYVILLCISLCIPIIINEIYKIDQGYITLWEAKDVLSFYGSFLSFIGTVVLGLIAINSAYCFLICMVYSLKEGYKWYLPFLTGLLFIPTMFIFYDISSIVYIALYIFVGCVGNLIGGLISDYIHKAKA